jgi:hypothetical protein
VKALLGIDLEDCEVVDSVALMEADAERWLGLIAVSMSIDEVRELKIAVIERARQEVGTKHVYAHQLGDHNET